MRIFCGESRDQDSVNACGSVHAASETISTMSSLNGHAGARHRRSVMPHVEQARPRHTAHAYDHVGHEYGCYANGEAGTYRFAHGDMILWEVIRAAIDELRCTGVSCVRVLDAGGGPGTWVRRIAAFANRLGLGIDAVGFDISEKQLEIARSHPESPKEYDPDARWKLEFLYHDLTEPLPWATHQFHLVLCNYVVLNHLPKTALSRAIEQLCRVGAYRVIASVRSVGSPPTGCIIGTEKLREYHQDCSRGELALELGDGSKHLLTFNFYSAETLRALFALHGIVLDLRAIDIFHSRFAPDMNWTGQLVNGLPGRTKMMTKLKEIEDSLCRQPGWIDHGTHVLIVSQPTAG